MVVHGDGTSLWTLTHNTDFARAFVGLLGHPERIGDKAHSMIFDNTKVRRLVPDSTALVSFHTGVREILAWYDADPARQQVDAVIDATMDHLVAAHRQVPGF